MAQVMEPDLFNAGYLQGWPEITAAMLLWFMGVPFSVGKVSCANWGECPGVISDIAEQIARGNMTLKFEGDASKATGVYAAMQETTREISNSVSQAAAGVQEVNENITQASAAVAEVTRDISHVSQTTDAMKSGGQKINESARELSGLAENFNTMVGQFTI